MTRSLPDRRTCGTRIGYQTHRAAGEEACPPCKAAHAAYQAEYRRYLSERESLDPRDVLQALREASDRDWTEGALCAQTDPELFFPEKGESTREAKAICRECPSRWECLREALDRNERFGVWGGLSERERRLLMGKRAA